MTNREWDVSEAWLAASVVSCFDSGAMSISWDADIFFFSPSSQEDRFSFLLNFPFLNHSVQFIFFFVCVKAPFRGQIVICAECDTRYDEIMFLYRRGKDKTLYIWWLFERVVHSDARSHCVRSFNRPRFCSSLNPTCHACQMLFIPCVLFPS